MFYVLVFSILAVVLVVGGISAMSRRRRSLERDEETQATHSPPRVTHSDASRRIRKEKRVQSRHARQKHH